MSCCESLYLFPPAGGESFCDDGWAKHWSMSMGVTNIVKSRFVTTFLKNISSICFYPRFLGQFLVLAHLLSVGYSVGMGLESNKLLIGYSHKLHAMIVLSYLTSSTSL